jgi:2-enoate reductase
VSASANPNFYLPDVPCRPLTDLELDKIIKNAAQAALDAKTMGMDGVYLHGHEGYLLDQLTSSGVQPTQAAASTPSGRLSASQADSDHPPPHRSHYPIMYRIDLSLALNETYGDRMNTVKSLKNFQNGRTIPDTLGYMANLVRDGVDLFDVDLGCYDNWWLPHPPAGMPAGCFWTCPRPPRITLRSIISSPTRACRCPWWPWASWAIPTSPSRRCGTASAT